MFFKKVGGFVYLPILFIKNNSTYTKSYVNFKNSIKKKTGSSIPLRLILAQTSQNLKEIAEEFNKKSRITRKLIILINSTMSMR